MRLVVELATYLERLGYHGDPVFDPDRSMAILKYAATCKKVQLAGGLKRNTKRVDRSRLPATRPIYTDKVSNGVFSSDFAEIMSDDDGPAEFAVGAYRHRESLYAKIVATLNDLELEPLDKETASAALARLENGQFVFSATQICKDIGKANDSASVSAVFNSLDKMAGIRAETDLTALVGKYNGFDASIDVERLKAKTYLLPLDIIYAEDANGFMTEAYFQFLRYPEIWEFGRIAGQRTDIPYKAAQFPNKVMFKGEDKPRSLQVTDKTLKINDYLRNRIVSTGLSPKILLVSKDKNGKDTGLFVECLGTPTPPQRAREIKTIETLLEHYRQTGLLSSYKIDGNCITIRRKTAPKKRSK